eukprot:211915-Pelagomonas_calceolata.AAC.3
MSGPRTGAIHSEESCKTCPTMPATPPAFHPSPYNSSLYVTAALPAAPLPSAACYVFHFCCQWCCCFHGSKLGPCLRKLALLMLHGAGCFDARP